MIDQWHDWLRLMVFFVCLTCVGILVRRWFGSRHLWNQKTLDYWYALVMWSLAGCVITIEGILQDLQFGTRSIFVIAAAVVTLKGLLKKGSWGQSA